MTVVKNAAGEEIALGAQGFGGYKAVPKKALQPARRKPASLKIGDKTYTAGDALVNRKTKAVSTVTDTPSPMASGSGSSSDKKTGTRTVLTSGAWRFHASEGEASWLSRFLPESGPGPHGVSDQGPCPAGSAGSSGVERCSAVT